MERQAAPIQAKAPATLEQYLHMAGRLVLVGALFFGAWFVAAVGAYLCVTGTGPWVSKARVSVIVGAVVWLLAASTLLGLASPFLAIVAMTGTIFVLDQIQRLPQPAWFVRP